MKRQILLLTLAALAWLGGGCLPDEYLWWSPDGQAGTVRASDGLRLTDAQGRLSPVILTGEILSASWLPNGTGLVVSRIWRAEDWTAAEKLVPAEEAAATKRMALVIPDLLRAGLTVAGGSWDDLNDRFLKPLGIGDSQTLESAWWCALSLHRDQLKSVAAAFPNAHALQAELQSAETNGIPIHELTYLAVHAGQVTGRPQGLVRSLRPLLDPVLAPHHPALAFRTGERSLQAMLLKGGQRVTVADENVARAVWSADGQSLIYVVMGESDKVGEIRSRAVIGEDGELRPGAPQAETLVMAAFPAGAAPRLCVLPDGRVLFASVAVTLPAGVGSIHPGAQFFLLDPARPAAGPVAVPVREGSLPDDLRTFALSPEGGRVAVVEAGTDAVAVFELRSGQVRIVSPPHRGWQSRMIPAWLNERELTFAALPVAGAVRPELMLWQTGAAGRILSQDWPDRVVLPWLTAPQEGE